MNLYASRYLINKKIFFVKEFCPKNLNFTIAGHQILWAENISTTAILLANKSSIRLDKIAYGSNCESNLMFFGQLQENNIIFIDNKDYISLI